MDFCAFLVYSIDASLRKLEQTVSQTCSPLVNAVADSSDRVLVVIDDKVDRSIGLLTMQIERITELRQVRLLCCSCQADLLFLRLPLVSCLALPQILNAA